MPVINRARRLAVASLPTLVLASAAKAADDPGAASATAPDADADSRLNEMKRR